MKLWYYEEYHHLPEETWSEGDWEGCNFVKAVEVPDEVYKQYKDASVAFDNARAALHRASFPNGGWL